MAAPPASDAPPPGMTAYCRLFHVARRRDCAATLKSAAALRTRNATHATDEAEEEVEETEEEEEEEDPHTADSDEDDGLYGAETEEEPEEDRQHTHSHTNELVNLPSRAWLENHLHDLRASVPGMYEEIERRQVLHWTYIHSYTDMR